jgi:hypothetical protein
MQPPDPGTLRYLSIEFSPAGITEIGRVGNAEFVAREDVRRITLVRRSLSERPGRELVYGIGLAVIAFVGMGKGAVVGPLVAMSLSAWMLLHVVRTPFQLVVEASRSRHALRIRGRVEPSALTEFLRRASSVYGYEIEFRVNEMSFPPQVGADQPRLDSPRPRSRRPRS